MIETLYLELGRDRCGTDWLPALLESRGNQQVEIGVPRLAQKAQHGFLQRRGEARTVRRAAKRIEDLFCLLQKFEGFVIVDAGVIDQGKVDHGSGRGKRTSFVLVKLLAKATNLAVDVACATDPGELLIDLVAPIVETEMRRKLV